MASSSCQNYPFATNGREKEYAQLMKMVCPMMAMWLRRHVSDRYDREEILEITIIKGWEAYPTLKEEATGRSWMMTILVRETSNYRRHEQRKGNRREGREEYDEELHSGTGTAEDALLAKIDWERVQAKLTVKEKVLLCLEIEGYSSEEIGKKIGKTSVAVRKSLSRIKEKIRRYFPDWNKQ